MSMMMHKRINSSRVEVLVMVCVRVSQLQWPTTNSTVYVCDRRLGIHYI